MIVRASSYFLFKITIASPLLRKQAFGRVYMPFFKSGRICAYVIIFLFLFFFIECVRLANEEIEQYKAHIAELQKTG